MYVGELILRRGEEGRRAVVDGPVLGLSNQQADKQPWPFTFEKRGAVISTVRGDRGAADGMVPLAFSCRTLWTSHECFFVLFFFSKKGNVKMEGFAEVS